MNCPHCNQPLPDNYSAGTCPNCRKSLAGDGPGVAASQPRLKINWLWFLVALLTPPLLTLCSAFLGKTFGDVAPIIALFGSGIGGIASGIIAGINLGSNPPARVGLSVVFSGIMVLVCIVLSFIGCSVGGYQLDLK